VVNPRKAQSYTKHPHWWVSHQGTHKGCPYGVWGEMRIHDAGTMRPQGWDELPNGFRHISLDVFVVVKCKEREREAFS